MTKKQEKTARDYSAPIGPNEIVRFRDGVRYFGYRATQLKKKIDEGLIPPPIPLSDDGRALGWLGQQILDYQKKRLAAAEKRALPAKA